MLSARETDAASPSISRWLSTSWAPGIHRPHGAIDMAKPLTRDGAIPLLEDAVHLLRRAPLATLLCHLVGSAPLVLGLLIFWNDVTNTHTSNSTCARSEEH